VTEPPQLPDHVADIICIAALMIAFWVLTVKLLTAAVG
jgi:hypothetical protein